MKSFLLNLTLVNVALYASGVFMPVFKDFAVTWPWLATVLFYFALTTGLVSWLNRASRRSPIQFVTAVNGSTAIKMFSSLAIVTTYLVSVGGEYRIHFSLGLFVVFAVNTFFLVMEAQTLSRKKSN